MNFEGDRKIFNNLLLSQIHFRIGVDNSKLLQFTVTLAKIFLEKISENMQPPVPINANTNSSVNSSHCLPHPLMNVSYVMVQRPQNKETDTCFKLTMVSLQTCYCELVFLKKCGKKYK